MSTLTSYKRFSLQRRPIRLLISFIRLYSARLLESALKYGCRANPLAIPMGQNTDQPLQAKQANNVADLKPIYFVSGLGADERIFQGLRYDGFRPVHIQWILPEKGEPIEDYAARLSEQIKDDNPVVVGLSFGGLIAVEIGKQIKTEKIILLSSVKDVSEVPFYFKIFRALPLHRIVPFKSLLWAFYWLAYLLFAPEEADQKQLLKTVLIETDPHFLKWALHKVVTWRNQEVPENLVHVHGKGDRIFPFRFVHPDYTVENSGHLMVMNRAEEISDLLEQLILQPEKVINKFPKKLLNDLEDSLEGEIQAA